jgi:hypothetical protein
MRVGFEEIEKELVLTDHFRVYRYQKSLRSNAQRNPPQESEKNRLS